MNNNVPPLPREIFRMIMQWRCAIMMHERHVKAALDYGYAPLMLNHFIEFHDCWLGALTFPKKWRLCWA